MEPAITAVKPSRVYDGARRRADATRRRSATLAVARELFLQGGFGGTTVDAVASTAGVSAATVYKTYGGKTGLVRALCEEALRGSGPVPAETRSDALRRISDAHEIVRGWGRLASEVSPRVSPLLLVLRAAADADPDAAVLLDELERGRWRRMAGNARFLGRAGHLRAGVTTGEATDVLWAMTSPDLYDLLVRRRRWSRARYGRFIASTIEASLLEPGNDAAPR